jgi:ferredoxin
MEWDLAGVAADLGLEAEVPCAAAGEVELGVVWGKNPLRYRAMRFMDAAKAAAKRADDAQAKADLLYLGELVRIRCREELRCLTCDVEALPGAWGHRDAVEQWVRAVYMEELHRRLECAGGEVWEGAWDDAGDESSEEAGGGAEEQSVVAAVRGRVSSALGKTLFQRPWREYVEGAGGWALTVLSGAGAGAGVIDLEAGSEGAAGVRVVDLGGGRVRVSGGASGRRLERLAYLCR